MNIPNKCFMIMGLPRSRTAWLSYFMTTENTFCYHELVGSCTSLEEIKNKLQLPKYEIVGFSDTCGHLIHEEFTCPKIIIHRDIEEVNTSLQKLYCTKISFLSLLETENKRLQKVQGLHIEFEEIDSSLKQIWEYCTDIPFDKNRASLLINMNIQTKILYPSEEAAKFINSLREKPICH